MGLPVFVHTPLYQIGAASLWAALLCKLGLLVFVHNDYIKRGLPVVWLTPLCQTVAAGLRTDSSIATLSFLQPSYYSQ